MRLVVRQSVEKKIFILADMSDPVPLSNETVVRIHAFSLNQGEVRRAVLMESDGWRPGWDLPASSIALQPTAAGPLKERASWTFAKTAPGPS